MSKSAANVIRDTLDIHEKLIAGLRESCADTIIESAELIIGSLKKGGTLYICGNGGSAADAQHIAAEFVGRFKKDRKALPAIALTTNSSLLTSIANDYKYEETFVRPVEALVRSDDVLWAISTSGSSANVIAAARLARTKSAAVLAFTGKAGSELEQLADVCLCAGSNSTARTQEIHQIAYHIICELAEQRLCES